MENEEFFSKLPNGLQSELFSEFYDYVTRNIIPSFTQKQCADFKIYFNELVEWNKMFNLISYKNEKEILYRHFADSLYAAKAILELQSAKREGNVNGLTRRDNTLQTQDKQSPAECKISGQDDSAFCSLKIADLGTGSGMPGIPVKIVLPDIKLTLVESITKKCSFLDNADKKLGFDIEILNRRAEEIGQDKKYREKYNIVLSRAVSKFSPNLEISIPLLKKGGHFIVHKTRNSAQSLQEGLSSVENALRHLGAKLVKTIDYKLPDNDTDYQILVFEKYKDTPIQFPRKTGIPEKKPL
jgi:16S rRNA (guanine527-N7)-methyltransferase